MSSFAKTRAAAGWIGQHAPSDIARARAAMLAGQATRCEAKLATANGHAPTANGHAPTAAYGLLRALVLTARDLAGRSWLEASSDDPAVAAFTALLATARPPAIAEIDETISRLLWARFAPPGRQDTTTRVPGQMRAPARVGVPQPRTGRPSARPRETGGTR